jgi:hypothetical protein
VHSQAVQLLCGCLDVLNKEVDAVVRKRCLSIVCRIIRTYGTLAAHLARDLGFIDTIKQLHDIQKDDFEKSILSELALKIT